MQQTREAPPQEYFDLVNEVMPQANPIGAYCLGLSALIWLHTGKVPPRGVMEKLASCSSIPEGILVVENTLKFAGVVV